MVQMYNGISIILFVRSNQHWQNEQCTLITITLYYLILFVRIKNSAKIEGKQMKYEHSGSHNLLAGVRVRAPHIIICRYIPTCTRRPCVNNARCACYHNIYTEFKNCASGIDSCVVQPE